MSAAYQEIAPAPSAFDRAMDTFMALKTHMHTADAMRMTHGELEAHVIDRTRTIARDMLQGHLDLRTVAERPVHVVGEDGAERAERRASSRQLRTLVGEVVLGRLLYQAAGAHGLAPQDAALSLAKDSFSMGCRRRVAEEVACGSFDHAVEAIGKTSGATIAKRQTERLARASVADFDEFYCSLEWEPESDEQLLVLTMDGAGIIMRTDSLRPATRHLAEKVRNRRSGQTVRNLAKSRTVGESRRSGRSTACSRSCARATTLSANSRPFGRCGQSTKPRPAHAP